jgi:hypothetical protein
VDLPFQFLGEAAVPFVVSLSNHERDFRNRLKSAVLEYYPPPWRKRIRSGGLAKGKLFLQLYPSNFSYQERGVFVSKPARYGTLD